MPDPVALLKERRAFTVASLARTWECSEGVIRKLIGKGHLRRVADAVQRQI